MQKTLKLKHILCYINYKKWQNQSSGNFLIQLCFWRIFIVIRVNIIFAFISYPYERIRLYLFFELLKNDSKINPTTQSKLGINS